jgi:hypothetical protein
MRPSSHWLTYCCLHYNGRMSAEHHSFLYIESPPHPGNKLDFTSSIWCNSVRNMSSCLCKSLFEGSQTYESRAGELFAPLANFSLPSRCGFSGWLARWKSVDFQRHVTHPYTYAAEFTTCPLMILGEKYPGAVFLVSVESGKPSALASIRGNCRVMN